MTAKEYLQQYADAVRIAQRLKTEYEDELDQIDNIRSALGGDGLPKGGGISKTVEERAIRLADKALEWKHAELDAIRIRQEIFETIMSVPGAEGDVLYERYINLKSWSKVAQTIGYSKRQACNLERRGLELVKHFIELHSD